MRRLGNLFLFGLLSLVALSSCATLYQKESVFSNGYSQYRTSSDTFVVSFRANEQTHPDKVMEYILRRSAEVTLKHGFHYFTILDQKEAPHYPSLRLTIQCFHEKPLNCDSLDATLLRS